MSRLRSIVLANLICACVLDSATVGEDETATEGGSGSGGSGAEATDGQTSADPSTTSPDTQGSGCPPLELDSCDATRRDLAVDFNQAVAELPATFAEGRDALTAAIGAAGATDPAAVATALEIAVGTTVLPSTPSCADTLEGARAMLQACDPGTTADGFGCQGDCRIDAAQEPACAEQGRVKCFMGFGGQCPGLCEGLCDHGVPVACDGLCVGTCDGHCDCVQELGLCTSTCDGLCGSMCISSEPTMCEGGCAGLCEFDEPPGPDDCMHDGVLCVDAGPGVCVLDCKGIPTAPAGVPPCCADLVPIAGILAASCTPPELSWRSGPECPEGSAASEPIKQAIAELLVVQRRAELLEQIAAAVATAIADPPSPVDDDPCWHEAWADLQAAVDTATTDLVTTRQEIDALVDALQ